MMSLTERSCYIVAKIPEFHSLTHVAVKVLQCAISLFVKATSAWPLNSLSEDKGRLAEIKELFDSCLWNSTSCP